MTEEYVDGTCLVINRDMFENCKEKYLLSHVEYIGEDDYEEDTISHIYIVAIPRRLIGEFRKESFIKAFDFD